MTEQQACTLCGADGHTAANCIWNGSEKGLALVQRIDKNLAEREQFESWVRREWPGAPLHHVRDALPKDDPRYGEYCNEMIQRAWVGWQASRATLVVDLPPTITVEEAAEHFNIDEEGIDMAVGIAHMVNGAIAVCAAFIKQAGIEVKP
ncbi:hypothetical protein [Pseudomonas sp. C9-3]|uniref:hypothetical protein n=1 Tax=Pseudomonas sp. C9-3 TaxID=3078264 RepID=UPI0028E9C470|nr:hypothetical protein [Pseudomonas sp. C9-3]